MSTQYTLQEEKNLRLVSDVYEHVLNPLNGTYTDRYFRPDYIQHNPMAETGSQGLKDFLRWAKGQSPDAVHHVKRIFADGDHVVAHVHVIIEPGTPGNAVIDIFRIEGDLIAEHWDVMQPVPEQSSNENGMF